MKEKNRLSLFFHSVQVGFVGGTILALLHLFFHYFNMIEVSPMTILNGIGIKEKVLTKVITYCIFIIVYIVISILCSSIYFVLFKNIYGWIFGACLGVFLWLLIYICFPYIFYKQFTLAYYSLETTVGTICLFILYGIFVGYSISFYYKTNLVKD